MKIKLLLLSALIILSSCKKPESINNPNRRGIISEHAMVVSAREEASKIGAFILEQGGNAFDAMVATELALAVSYPYAGNIGGGGFMVYRTKNGSVGQLDYREKAPLAAFRDMYLDSLGEIVHGKSTLGALAVGIPGTIAGVFAVHERFGELPLQKILEPVIALAQRGIIVTEYDEITLQKFKTTFRKANKDSILFEKSWKTGDTIKFPQLAVTLKNIQKNGRDEFYKGETAQKIVSFIQENGGIITMEDMANYQAIWREPIIFEYDNLRIISCSPPSSGGICLAQIMGMLESYRLKEYGHNSTAYIQLLTEAERRSYADRSYYLGDPDFITIPTQELIDKNYLKERMMSFSFEKATSSSEVFPRSVEIVESSETTHYSIVDQFGNSIAATTTLNGAFGSKLYCSELGFFLNNEMDDFSSKPGTPNIYGLIGGEANAIAPKKRMLSSMTPTIIEKEGKLWMVLGTPGGSTIITSVLQTILNVHEFDMTMQEAVDAGRFHHQWLPDEIVIEPNRFDSLTISELQNKGYKINANKTPIIGKVDAILVLKDGFLEGAADTRGDDTAVGF